MSATPDREYGEEGNEFIKSEIGSTFYKFGLEEAIQKNFVFNELYYHSRVFFI